jgi:hypothetical protein
MLSVFTVSFRSTAQCLRAFAWYATEHYLISVVGLFKTCFYSSILQQEARGNFSEDFISLSLSCSSKNRARLNLKVIDCMLSELKFLISVLQVRKLAFKNRTALWSGGLEWHAPWQFSAKTQF